MAVDVEVVSAHHERAVVRVGDVFLKVEPDGDRRRRELEAMERAPVPVAHVLWHRPPVLALAALPGRSLARLGETSTASSAAWAAAGAMARRLHDAPVPPWPGWDVDEHTAFLDSQCQALRERGLVSPDVVDHHRRVAGAALRPFERAFIHGDLQAEHVLVDGDEVIGVLDWSDALAGDPLFDLAVLTVGHEEHLEDVLRGYARDVDQEAIKGWWAFRRLCSVLWMAEHGYDPQDDIASLERGADAKRGPPSPGGGG